MTEGIDTGRLLNSPINGKYIIRHAQKIIDLIRIVNNKNDGLKHYNLLKYLFIFSNVFFLIVLLILLVVIWHQLLDHKSAEAHDL